MVSAARLTYWRVTESFWTGVSSSVAGAPDRERQRELLLDPAEEQAPLGRLELLRVLLGLGQAA